MDIKNKATSIDLFSLKTRPMRSFHMTWFAFFLCFFAWFGIAPLLSIVKDEFNLTGKQLGNTMIASVAITIVARLIIGWLCDKIGPRITYTWLLILGSIPVMCIGFADSYLTFLLFRLGIGVIGASFVITQYHTSVMFAPNVVGTANATSAGWGNLGGGVTQMVMPVVLTMFIWFGFSEAGSWRLSMLLAGVVCLLTGIAYYFFTTDFPDGNMKDLRARGEYDPPQKVKGAFAAAAKDYRVWALFIIYAACFGIELTINGMAVLYFQDAFHLGLKTAGIIAGLFGLMNIFARTLGGFVSDRFVMKGGLQGRVKWLFIALLAEGIALVFFSQMRMLAFAIPMMIIFSLFVQMSEGATFSVVPFINKKAIGSVAGIVGAGGNAGAVAGGFLLRNYEPEFYAEPLFYLGLGVFACAFFAILVRFSPAQEADANEKFEAALARRREERADRKPIRELVPGLKHLRPMDALRIYIGIALVVKGVYFIMNMAELEANLGGMGQGQQLIAWSVVFAHVIGGSALALGFVTRVAAAINAIILAGATVVSLTGSWEGSFLANVDFQLSALVFFTCVLFVWRGSGPLSVDHLLRIDSEKEPEIIL